MDRSAQLDEIDSLKSIYYSEEFQVTDLANEKEKIQAIFWAYCKLPENYTVKYLEVPGSHAPSYLKVQHLPPIELRLTFPFDYPSKSPPGFVISCQWLPISKISLLCKKLDALWDENGAVEIVYIWCDFLKNDSLNFLDCQNELDLRELCSKHLCYLQRSERAMAKKNNTPKPNSDSTQEVDIVQIPLKSLTEVKESDNKECNNSPGTSMPLINNYNVKVAKKSHSGYNREHPYVRRECLNKGRGLKRNGKMKFDERAVLDLKITTSPIRLLENFNAEREKVQFLRNFYTCNICFSDKLGKDCTKFVDCNHVFCIDCIRSYFTVKIKDGTVQSIKCPEDKCSTEALPSQVKEIVSEELYTKYDTVLLNTALDTLSDIIYCPRQICQYPVSWDPAEKMASCPNCQYVFCVTCKMVYHGVEPCQYKSVEVRKLVDKYENATTEVKAQLESKYGKKHLESLVTNCKAEKWIEDNSKTCPKCEVAIEKSHGCNKMICWKCNAYFCWLCGVILDVQDPYVHFRDPNSKCANKLFYLVYDEVEDDWDWVEDNGDEFEGYYDDDDVDYDIDIDDDDDEDDLEDDEYDENDLSFLGNVEF